MQFFYPIGLLALAGIIIPLIIHLWNIKQGKTLKIGSIALLGESSRASSRSFKLTDILLFILRCLLIILIGFCIAQPYITKKLNAKENGGWILVDKSRLKSVYQTNKTTIDSLLEIHYEIHDFNIGFTPLKLQDTSNIEKLDKETNLNYTSLLNQLNHIIPAGTSVFAYQDLNLVDFGNTLPKTKFNLHWKFLNDADSVKSWFTDFAGKKFKATSTPNQTTYEVVNNQNPVPISVAVYDGDGNDDKYLVAALNAIGGFSGRKILINSSAKNNIGFWLSEKPVSEDFKTSIIDNGTLFKYADGKVISTASFINVDGEKIPIFKRIVSGNHLNNILTDGFGNSILSKEKVANISELSFYSRFNPQWNEMVWNEEFVKVLMPIVLQSDKPETFGFEDNLNDQRRLKANQFNKTENNIRENNDTISTNQPLSNLFWLAALIVFVAERILSFRNKTDYAKN